MHFSSKRGLSIACRLSVCLSVCPVRPSVCLWRWWNSSEVISSLVSLGCSLSADPNIRGLFQGEHPEILAQSDPPPVNLSVGDIRSQIAAEWLQIVQRSQRRAYVKPSLFWTVPLYSAHRAVIFAIAQLSCISFTPNCYSCFYRAMLRRARYCYGQSMWAERERSGAG